MHIVMLVTKRKVIIPLSRLFPYNLCRKAFMEILLLFPLAFSLVAFLLYLVSWWRWEELRRYNARTRYHFDALGNPEFFYDSLTEKVFLAPPGNTHFPAQNIFVSGVQTTVKKPERPPAITTSNGDTIDAFVVQSDHQEAPPGETLLPGEKELFQLESGETLSLSTSEIADFMRACKAERVGKMKVFEKLGLKPGKSQQYQVWSKFWNSLD